MYMFWCFNNLPAEAAQMFGLPPTTVSGSETTVDDSLFHEWQRQMDEYNRVHHNHFQGSPKCNFWVVVGLPVKDFSENLVWHDTIPMLIPASGTGKMIGIAQTRAELDKMVSEDEENIHLTYKVRLQGPNAWRKFLELVAEHNMLEKEGS